jgi:beta-mannanase
MSWFQNWDTGWLTRQAADAAATGHDLLIALEPMHGNGRPVSFREIAAGAYDGSLRAFFTMAQAFPSPVVVRFAHEMNHRHPWSMGISGAVTSTEDWIAAWRHLVTLSRRLGDNVRWMWCVNNVDGGGVPAEAYWPGADVVDVIGIDGYNGFGPWATPEQVFTPMYSRVTRLSSRPVWIAEVGCRDVGPGEKHSKAAWLEALLSDTHWPRVERIIFFSADKEHDWRLDSSREVAATIAKATSLQAGGPVRGRHP